jgi:alpha-tubulin suppressor-like RCC1 family protein
MVVAWGNNSAGQTAVPVGLSGVKAIAAGASHTAALKNDGMVAAWGNNDIGQTTVPAGLSGVKAIAAGALHTTALKNDGKLVAWGLNDDGQTNVPPILSDVKAITAGYDYIVALKNDGTVMAWGANSVGQTTVPAGLRGVKAIAAAFTHTVALKNDGTVVAWGFNSEGQTTVPADLSDVIAIAADQHSVALKNDGTVVAWGRNTQGQATVPAGLIGVQAVAAGGGHTVALKSDGIVVAWGYNSHGQATVPAGLSDVKAIAAGGSHTVALKNDGTVVAWGANYYGQVTVPAGLNDVKAIAAGSNHTIALKTDGTVVSWGRNDAGQAMVPAGLSDVTSIAAGFDLSVVFSQAKAIIKVTITPSDSSATAGQSITFTATARGATPFTYQWRRNGVAIPKATDATLVLTNLQRSQEGLYDVVVKNALGVALSNAARLSFPPLVPITTAPVDVDVNPAGTGSFSVDVPGATAWQWLKNGLAIRNATSSTLNVMNVDASAAGLYSVTVTTPAGKITTAPAQLRLNDSGLLIYKLTGTGTAYGGTTATTGAVTGFLVLDRAEQRGGFLFNSKSGSQNIHRLEVHEDLNTQSAGPVPKTQTVVSELVAGEYSLWLNGTDGLLTISKTDKAVGPATLKGQANSIDFGQTLRLETVSLTAALDALNSAPARLDGETVEQALNRLSQALQVKGSALVE